MILGYARKDRFDPRPCPGWPDGLILYDGACALCSTWVAFVIRRDEMRRFRFLSLQSAAGRRLAVDLCIDPDDPETNVLVLGGTAFFKSDAAVMAMRHLRGMRWARFLGLVPKRLRDWLYDRVARNRYRLFGRREACLIPDAGLADRFLDAADRLRVS